MSQLDEAAIVEAMTLPENVPLPFLRDMLDLYAKVLSDALKFDFSDIDNEKRVTNPMLRTIRDSVGDMGLLLVHIAAVYDTTLAAEIATRFNAMTQGLYGFGLGREYLANHAVNDPS